MREEETAREWERDGGESSPFASDRDRGIRGEEENEERERGWRLSCPCDRLLLEAL